MLSVNREQIELLVKMQEIDKERDKISSHLKIIPDKLKALEERQVSSETVLVAQEEAHEELKKVYRSKESDIKLNGANIKKCNERLFSVKTNKEYQAILKEIEELNRKTSDMEDEMLEILERLEADEKQINQKKEELDQLKKEVEEEKRDLEKEQTEEENNLSTLDTEWDGLQKNIASDLLERFITIRSRSKGVAIAEVRNLACQGCYMNIPPQLYNELQQQRDTLQFCPYCHRMIYWKSS